MASAMPSTSSGSTRMPLTPSSTTSGTPPTRPPTTARPRQNASSTMRGVPSARDGRAAARRRRARARSPPRLPASTSRDRTLRRALGDVTPVPVADQAQRGFRRRSATSRQAAARFSTFLYGSSTPTKSARGSSGRSAGGRSDERLEVGEGDEGGRRLHTGLARQAGRVRRQRAHGVGAAQHAHGATRSVTGDSARRSGEP